ncbi:MAG: hypothetical protein WBP79_05535, partial [Candidatus Acidiferrales bacterium]
MTKKIMSGAFLAVITLMVQGGTSIASAQTPMAEKFAAIAAAPTNVPEWVAYDLIHSATPGSFKDQNRILKVLETGIVEKKEMFCTPDAIALATFGHGRIQIDGFQKEYNGKALLHPSSASPT